MLITFADDTTLGKVANTTEDREIDLEKLEIWTGNNAMRFNYEKCKLLNFEEIKQWPRIGRQMVPLYTALMQ